MFKNKNLKIYNKGFMLFESPMMLIVTLIVFLFVVIAINPVRQFAKANNTNRMLAVEKIANAIARRISVNKGVFEGTIIDNNIVYICPKLPTNVTKIAQSKNGVEPLETLENGDLSCLIPVYIEKQLPVDPKVGKWLHGTKVINGEKFLGEYDTGFTVVKNSNGTVTVAAPHTELTKEISIISITK